MEIFEKEIIKIKRKIKNLMARSNFFKDDIETAFNLGIEYGKLLPKKEIKSYEYDEFILWCRENYPITYNWIIKVIESNVGTIKYENGKINFQFYYTNYYIYRFFKDSGCTKWSKIISHITFKGFKIEEYNLRTQKTKNKETLEYWEKEKYRLNNKYTLHVY